MAQGLNARVQQAPAAPGVPFLKQAAVEVDSLSHTYPARRREAPCRALDRVSMTVAPGEMVAVLGPNGSGKSTLLRVLMTLSPPQEGQVRVEGLDVVRQAHAVRRAIGAVFQQPALDSRLKVRENLYAAGRLYGLKGADLGRRLDEALQQVGLEDRRDSLVGDLSGGLARRAELAKALLSEPRLLIMDEPTTGIDPAARRDFWTLLGQRRQASGMAVVTTTHILEEAEQCDRVAILDAGALLAYAPPAELRQRVGHEILRIRADDLESVERDLERELGLEGQRRQDEFRLALTPEQDLDPLRRLLGTRLRSLHLAPPSLDDVFMHFTGRSLAGDS